MADPITIPNIEGTEGIPSQYSQTINNPLGAVFLSTHPEAVTYEYAVAINAEAIPAFTVVGFDDDDQIVIATNGVAPIKAIGVLAQPVPANAGTEPLGALVYRSGHFNHKRLLWDASFTDDVSKIMAFEGAPTPTYIRVGTPKTYTP